MLRVEQLENGLRVVGEENESVRTISIGIWIKNGSVDEDESTNGISHFIEHMLFKGTKNRTARDIAEEMAEVGGRINAFTGKEYMCYYAHVLEAHFDVALDVLSDMVCRSTFNEIDMEREKGVIIEEIKMCEDSPEDIVNDLLELGTWQNASLGLNILGTEENVRGFTREDLLSYVKKHYIAENIVISVAGKMNFDEVLVKIKEAFKDLPSGTPTVRPQSIKYHKSFLYKNKDFEQVHACLAFPGVSYDSKDIYTLSVLNTILGGGINSRLFQSIREEKGLAYSIYSYPETYKNNGLFIIYVATNPGLVEEVITSILDQVELLITEGLKEKELLRMKEQIKSNLIIGLESMNSRMNNNGKSQLILDRIKSQDEIIENIDAVTEESLIAFAKRILNFSNMSVAIVGNLEEVDIERIETLCKR